MFQQSRRKLAILYGSMIGLIVIIMAVTFYLILSTTIQRNAQNELKDVNRKAFDQLKAMADKTNMTPSMLLLAGISGKTPYDWGFLSNTQFGIISVTQQTQQMVEQKLNDYKRMSLEQQDNGKGTIAKDAAKEKLKRDAADKIAAADNAAAIEQDAIKRMSQSAGTVATASFDNYKLPTDVVSFWLWQDIDAKQLTGRHSTADGRTFVTALTPLKEVDVDLGYLYIGKEVTDDVRLLAQMRLLLAALGIVLLLVASAVGYAFSGRAMVPIRQAYKRQQSFVADASHELRTPLSVLRASAEVLEEAKDAMPAFHRVVLHSMGEELGRMSQLVDGLLTLARSDDGTAPLQRGVFDLHRLAAGVVETMRPYANSYGVALAFAEADEDAKSALYCGDSGRIKQLLMILLDNAIKYNKPGGEVAVRLATGADGSCELTVTDNGIGISADDLPLIFERFYRADKARSRDGGGSGLGLAIAAWIAQAHGGAIAAFSEPGSGSTFVVSLPASAG